MRRKKNAFFTTDTGTYSNIERDMLTKEEQNSMKSVKKRKISLFNTEDVEPFNPNDEFFLFRDIQGEKIHIFSPINKEDEFKDKEEKIVRCQYCGKEHNIDESVFIPDLMYNIEENGETVRYYQGNGYYHTFECAYRVVLNMTTFNAQNSSLYNISKYLLLNMFSRFYPDEELKPAPTFELMETKWNGKYTLHRVNGVGVKRVPHVYQVTKNI